MLRRCGLSLKVGALVLKLSSIVLLSYSNHTNKNVLFYICFHVQHLNLAVCFCLFYHYYYKPVYELKHQQMLDNLSSSDSYTHNLQLTVKGVNVLQDVIALKYSNDFP